MKRLLPLLLVASCVSLQAQTPTRAQIDKILDKAKADIDALYVTPPVTTSVALGASLQAAIGKAAVGATLTLPANYVTTEALTVAKTLTIRGQSGAKLLGGVWVTGTTAVTVTLANVELRTPDHYSAVVDNSGLANLVLSGVRCLGDPVLGQKRCVAANGGAFTMQDSVCASIFWSGEDSQCIVAWDSPGPFTIERNQLSAASENILFGGGDPSSASRVPSNIVIRGNTLTKDLAWRTQAVDVKNFLELKNAHRVVIEDNTMAYNFSGAQQGWAVLFTPRNQDGTASYSSVEDVLFQRNTVRHTVAALQLMGDDYDHPSGRLQRVRIVNNRFEDIDPQAWQGTTEPASQMILVSRGPNDVTIDGNVFLGRNIGSALYFSDVPRSTNFTFTNNQIPKSTYGIFGENAAVGAAWAQWVASGLLQGNIEQ
jgi:hypothetical protein